MRNVLQKSLSYSLAGIAAVAIIAGGIMIKNEKIGPCSAVERLPVIDPDYAGIVIPPNIAPLNFTIREGASRYRIKIYAATGDTIRVNAVGPAAVVNIPIRKWKRLLQSNRGKILTIDIYAKHRTAWRRFTSITNRIAREPIDGYLVYRIIFGYKSIPEMEIRQREIGSFNEKTVLNNRTLSTRSLACINCHAFCSGKPDRMIIHLRGEGQGMLLAAGKKIVKIDTRSDFNRGPASYASWHPGGDLLAFAVMNVTQALHSVGDPRVVFDETSDLIIYNIKSNLISTNPSIADTLRMETLPEWSPDGRRLYFCSAPRPEKIDGAFFIDLKYRDIKYDLMRIPFDIRTGAWGAPETVLSARETGMSNVHPKLSPDGRYLLFIMMPYSYFAVYDDSSDLCLMDLSTRKYRRLDAANSGYA
ncbi:MAG: PD40 domain-containing protein, partial [Chitinispirillaceae bacterium]|nr:PD40 domain-containing protein [Chitinispirillaceae bacterium]